MTAAGQSTVLLSWGARPVAADLNGWDVEVLEAARSGPWLDDWRRAVDEALDSPEGLPSLGDWLGGAGRVLVVLPHPDHLAVPDALVEHVVGRIEEALPDRASLLLVSSAGELAPRMIRAVRPGADPPADPGRAPAHDPRARDSLVPLGEVGRSAALSVAQGLLGEVVRVASGQSPSASRAGASAMAGRRRTVLVHEAAAGADRVVALGALVPHPVLGWTGGSTALVPGLSDISTIASIEEMAPYPVCGAGRIEGNPARDLVEEAVARLHGRLMCLDVVAHRDGRIGAVAAGTPARVLEVLAPLARETFLAPCRPSPSVIAAAPALDLESLLMAGAVATTAARTFATLLLVGQCPRGVGDPVRVSRLLTSVLLPRVSRGQVLVHTGLEAREIIRCGLRPVRGVQSALLVMRERARGDGRVTVMGDCSRLLPSVLPAG